MLIERGVYKSEGCLTEREVLIRKRDALTREDEVCFLIKSSVSYRVGKGIKR